jgi:hypothetical protein
MYWNRSSAAVQEAWQNEIDSMFEGGLTPFLDVGATLRPWDGVDSLLALQRLASQRSDLTAPLITGGGDGIFWLNMLLLPLASHAARSPGITFLYVGADPATYMATLWLETRRETLLPAFLGTPPVLRPFFAPHAAPGAIATWQALPFLVSGEKHPTLVSPGAEGSAGAQSANRDWLAWGTILLAVAMVVFALVL